MEHFQFKLIQDNQKDLEMATETLSEYLERDITSECLSDIKQKVQDKYRYFYLRAVPYYFFLFQNVDSPLKKEKKKVKTKVGGALVFRGTKGRSPFSL